MSDLSRLLDSSDDEVALSLLRSAREEPPEGSMGRVAAALGVGVGGALVSSASATALLASKAHAASLAGAGAAVTTEAAVAPAPWLASVIVKPLAIGLLGGLAAVGGVNYVSSNARPAEQRPVASPALQAPVKKAAPRTAQPVFPPPPAEVSEIPLPKAEAHRAIAPAPLASNRRPPEVAPKREAEPAPATASFATPAAVVEAPSAVIRQTAPPPDEALARELTILGRARSQLGAGDAAGALRTLNEYSAERRSGALEPEATTLRIQALERTGDRTSAARLARSFLKAHPERSHDDSLRSIAAEAP